MSIKLDKYMPLYAYLSPASIPQIVAHIQDYLVKHPILSVETIAEIIVQSLQEHPELINGEAIPISADSQQSIKAYIDALPFLDTYTKAEINALLLGKQDTLTFDQAPTPGSSNPVTSSGIIAAMSALQSALETLISAKADRASTYTKTQVDTLLEDKADAADVYSKNTIDAKLLVVNTDIDNLEDALGDQSRQIDNLQAAAAYVEDGDRASQTYKKGQFVLWKGLLYTVKAEGGMPQDEPINTTTYLEAVTGGGFNVLSEEINDLSNVDIGTYSISLRCVDLNGYKRFWYYWKSNQGFNYTITINSVIKSAVGTKMPTNFNVNLNKMYAIFYIADASFNNNEMYDFNITVAKQSV